MTTPRDLSIPIQRITWRDGQTLTSRDLRDDQLYADRQRHLHIRYLHRTWGVVEGLGVGKVAGDAVVVPGYALDSEGRELLLPKLSVALVPASVQANTTMYLVISWGTQTDYCQAGPDLATLCPGVQNALALQQGVLSWKTVAAVRLGRDVLLGRALVQGGKLASAVDTSIRRYATTMNQPSMWSGATLAGQTGWTDGTNATLPEIQATIDTSDGGFIATPTYFASVTGASPVAAGFISSAGATSFTFVVRPYAKLTGGTTVKAAKAESDGWTVTWLGIAQNGG